MERGGGVGGENMCEDLRSGSGNIGMCIPSARTDAIISIDASTCSLMNDEGNHCCSVLFCGRINCSFHSHQQTATHSFITIHCCIHI